MTRQRRHPAQASRIVAAGLGTASLLGIVAVLGAQPPAGTPPTPPEVASARIVLVARVPAVEQPGRRAPTPRVVGPPASPRRAPARQATRTPHTTTGPS
jgi:hypothetical protein